LRTFIQWQIDAIKKFFTPWARCAIGVISFDVSIVFAAYAPFSGEKAGVYWMSQLTMMIGGIVLVAEGLMAMEKKGKN
jgi:hypothetical protein